jgi:hypothetical protein
MKSYTDINQSKKLAEILPLESADMQEEWRDIEGYEGLYLVSNLGRIKSLSHLVISNRGSYMSKERIR